jgi:hypothetical protein
MTKHMTDTKFWAEARRLLDLNDGGVATLADYIHDDAESRDRDLQRLRQDRAAIYAAASARFFGATPDADPLEHGAGITLTAEEEFKVALLTQVYDDLFRHHAAYGFDS